MKHFLLTLLIVISGFHLSFAEKPPAVISVSLSGNAEGKKVYLQYADVSNEIVDSTIVTRGKCSLRIQLLSPRYMVIAVKDSFADNATDATVHFFADNSNIDIQANFDSLAAEMNQAYGNRVSRSAVITGSPSHQLYLYYYETKSGFDEERFKAFEAYIAYLNPPAGQVKGSITEGIELVNKIDEVEKRRKEYMVNYVLSKDVSEVLAFIASQTVNLNNISIAEVDKVAGKFSSSSNKSELLLSAFFTDAAISRKTAVGATLMDFQLKDSSGNMYKLSDFIGKGKYVLLEFWASWCYPCRADIPHIKEVYNLYKPKGFEVVSVSMDNNKDAWLKAMKEENMPWMQLAEPVNFESDLAKAYRIKYVPFCLLFDGNGKLVTRNMRGSWMDKILIATFGNRFKKP